MLQFPAAPFRMTKLRYALTTQCWAGSTDLDHYQIEKGYGTAKLRHIKIQEMPSFDRRAIKDF
jgi:hypothetical protein